MKTSTENGLKEYMRSKIPGTCSGNKFVEYLKPQEAFKLPYELYTWREIYKIVNNVLSVFVPT